MNLIDTYFISPLTTGPNMGGKSTYIRSIAMAVLLTQIGSYVPANSAIVSLVDGIFTRVGGCDQQVLGNSTFMAEMIETSNIVSTATENSLIIIDELGRGTSTADGFSIAYAVSKHIATVLKSFCLFATHFQELVKLEWEVPRVKTFHAVVYCPENDSIDRGVIMTHEIKAGPCLRSFGIHVAGSAGVPQDYITVAQEKLQELEETIDRTRYDFEAMEKIAKKEKPEEEMTDHEVWATIAMMKQCIKATGGVSRLTTQN
jgi:DNA mismatch repair protein MSH2